MKLSNDVEIEVTKMGQNYSFFLTVYVQSMLVKCVKHSLISLRKYLGKITGCTFISEPHGCGQKSLCITDTHI